jgi:transcriptional regulator of acetoin/glycerol metabolism
MKATLEYNLPEEQSEHADALNGYKWRGICQELDNILRNKMKYENVETMRLEDIRKELHQLADASSLQLWE